MLNRSTDKFTKNVYSVGVLLNNVKTQLQGIKTKLLVSGYKDQIIKRWKAWRRNEKIKRREEKRTTLPT